jgi:hypothetical protein
VFALAAAEGPRLGCDHLQPVSEVRDEEERLLWIALLDRCHTMRELQIAVHEGAKSLRKIMESKPDKKPSAEARRAGRDLAENQKAIVYELTTTANLVLSWALFPEVFDELRKDMEEVERRLRKGDVGRRTLLLLEENVETFRDMLKALRKG